MPTLKLKVLPRFPARVVGGDGITVTKTNGIYTISVDTGFFGLFTPGAVLYAGAGGDVTGLAPAAAGRILVSGSVPSWALPSSVLTLADFGATTSAQLAGIISDETGSGALVFATAPVLTNPVVGTQTPGDSTTKGASTAFVTGAISTALAFPLPPPGRITLTTGTGLTSTDVTGATSIYYNAMGGKYLSVYNGSAWQNIDVSTDLSLALATSGTNFQASGKNYDVFAAHVSGTNYFGTGPAWNDGAGAGSDTARGTGAASTEIEWFQGMPVNKNSMVLRHGSASGNTVTVPARQAILLGTIRMTADGITEDSFAKRFVSNAFNAVSRPMKVVDATSTWTYSTGSWRQANGAAANQLAYVQTLPGRSLFATVTVMVNSSTVTARLCAANIGIDSASPVGTTYNAVQANSDRFLPSFSSYRGFPGIGSHTALWLEIGAGADTQTWSGTSSFGIAGITGETLL